MAAGQRRSDGLTEGDAAGGAPRLRVGLVGCGWWSRTHLHAWQDLASEGAELIGVADVDRSKAEAAGLAFGVPAFESLGELVDVLQPDVVDIVTTVESHRDLALQAAARGVGIVLQKPMARDWLECLEIAEAVEHAGVFFAVHEDFRFQAAIGRVRRLIGKGVVGAPSFARISFRTAFDTTAMQPHLRAQERFILMDIGVHVLDVARALMGEVEVVSCETQRRRPELAGEDSAAMLLRHVSGAVSMVDCSFSAQRIRDVFPQTMIDVEGELGCIELREDGAIAVRSRGLGWREDAAAPLLEWTEHPLHVVQEGALTFQRHILDAWVSGGPPETDLDSSLATFALVEAAYSAAQTHRAVAPPARAVAPHPPAEQEAASHAG